MLPVSSFKYANICLHFIIHKTNSYSNSFWILIKKLIKPASLFYSIHSSIEDAKYFLFKINFSQMCCQYYRVFEIEFEKIGFLSESSILHENKELGLFKGHSYFIQNNYSANKFVFPPNRNFKTIEII